MSPLKHRILRQLKNNFGKYLGIFLMMAFMIAYISGFLTAAGSIHTQLVELPERYHLEDGRFTVTHKLDERQMSAAEKGRFSWLDRLTLSLAEEDTNLDNYEQLTVYPLFSHDLKATIPHDPVKNKRPINMRIYAARDKVNLPQIHVGTLPKTDDEIAIDVTFARNHQLKPGDSFDLAGHKLRVSGTVTLPDYTTLFEKNSDFVMDDFTFCVGVLTPQGYAAFADQPETYTYAYKFNTAQLNLAQRTTAERNLLRALSLADAHVTDLVDVTSNQGVNFAPKDTEGDSQMWQVLYYIIVIVMAFIFVVLTRASIEAESPVIGTLLASGYRRIELMRHYVILPMLVAIAAAIVGNLTQFVFIRFTYDIYSRSYSLLPFDLKVNPGVFFQVTVIPVLLLFVITVLGLASKLKYTPLAFLRHEATRVRRGHGWPLPERWPFFTRLRLRVLSNNIGSAFTIFFGIFATGILLIMGLGMMPIVEHMAEKMADAMPAQHVYTLRRSVELPAEDAALAYQAEKVEFATLQVSKKWNWGPMDITTYGIDAQGPYWKDFDVRDGKVVIGGGLAQKSDLAVGSTLALRDAYQDKNFSVVVSAISDNKIDTNVYMSREKLNELLGNKAVDFNGWVSNKDLHFDKYDVLSDLTPDGAGKMADQMRASMGSMMNLIVSAALIIYAIVIYLLSKTVLERSSRAISQLKVFGYRSGELSRVYIHAISLCVILSLILTVPVIKLAFTGICELIFMDYDLAPEIVLPPMLYVQYILIGLSCYAVVAIANHVHLSRVPLAVALKSQE
ncbi:FtsX-like permease family protein [Olegusella massiliensis]|uniref:FtsX-like permease family protein n=1 Tax=Olegusella massiliensis TaxID=1776381 RepID=UPI0040556F2A